jgi:predicted PurR-regulated permease PerM
MQIIFAILFASALACLIVNWRLFKNKRFSSTTFCGLFILKLFFGVCFYLVYTAYYSNNQTSDMHKYYNDAVKIFELTKENPRSYLSILTGLEIDYKDEIIT